ncbi:MAG: hypothetical protein ACRCUT_09890 [Spirochaetota bacterium]
MSCEKKIEKFMHLDRGEAIPLSLRFHILFCRRCRNEIFSLLKSFDSIRGKAPFEIPFDMSDLVMKRIEFLEIDYAHNISNTKWISAGIVIFASIFLVSFSDWADWLSVHTEGYFDIPLYIVMGLSLTVYSSLFIGTHLEYLKTLSDRFGSANVRHGKI